MKPHFQAIPRRSLLIEVIFGVAEYDQPKVYEAGCIPRSLLRNENELYRLDTP